MSSHDIEPLDPHTWFRRLSKLLENAQNSDQLSPETFIRRAYHLMKLSPGPFRDGLPIELEEQRVESMLACEAFESAVMALLGTQISFTVQKDGGANEVSVVMSLDASSAPGHGRHKIGAIAMVQAWVRCLANTAGLQLPGDPKDPVPRKSLSGSPPSSTEH